MSVVMNGSSLILPGLGPQVPFVPHQRARHLSSASTSRSTSLSSQFLLRGRAHQHSSHVIRWIARHDGYASAPRSDFRRNQGSEYKREVSSSGGRQDGYSSSPRLESRRNQGSDFTREVSSGGGRHEGSASAPRSDRRGNQGSNQFSSRQRSSGGGDRGGRQNINTATSRTLDPRRIHEGSNSNPRRVFDDTYNDVDSTARSYSRNSERGGFNSQKGRQAANGGEKFVVAKDGPRGRGARLGGRGAGGSVSVRSSSSKASPLTQTVAPRQSASQFVSDRAIYKAPWEQGTSSSSWRDTRDNDLDNPLIERLNRLKRMQEEVDAEDGEDADNDDDDDFHGLEAGSNARFGVVDDEAPFDGRGQNSGLARIVESLGKIPGPRNRGGVGLSDESSVGLDYRQGMVPSVERGWSTLGNPISTPAGSLRETFRPDTRFPWERDNSRDEVQSTEKFTRVKPPSLADLTLPEDELRRLRSLGLLTRHRIKVGKSGVTNGIVEAIHSEWRESEIVRVKCEGPPAQNMKRTHEVLEERTGGLVVWRAGGACLVYRGKDYVPPTATGLLGFSEQSTYSSVAESQESKSENEGGVEEDSETLEMKGGVKVQTIEPKIVVSRVSSIYDPELEKEMEDILSTLGPRYDDWIGMKPIPVDADLLVGLFKKPFRQLPYGVRSQLSNVELTNLRRLARPIPPHFVLGLNRGLEGLAVAIVKLWEKSEIAKIAVKRGIQNTNHERMAEELKRLTGGVLLSRDKFFIVLYRGKDFLPPSVAAVLEERRAMTSALQEEEEKARFLPQNREVSDTSVERSIAGTLAETLEAKANWERLQNCEDQLRIAEEVRKNKRRDTSRRIERKVAITVSKKHRAELELKKVEKRLRPAGPPVDRENITDEERHMLSKLGLKMHAFLLLGRRGVFDGTVENMHLHWKHRPLVKVIYKARDKLDLEQTARMLEYESGGILVATVATNKGQAIIVYRGKNYQRPPELRPRTLLTKRQALKRSIEMQRQQALTKHLLALENEIENMKADLSKLEEEDEDDENREDHEHEKDSHELTLGGPEKSEEELSEESTISELDSPHEDGEGIGDGTVGQPSKKQNQDLLYRADPLSRRERLILRQQALNEQKSAAHFNVGRSNVLAGLARAIRIHFRKHALVKVGVRGRAEGTPVEEILSQLQEATGGTLVSHEHSKVILYRGWPDGQEKGVGGWQELPPQLRSAMLAEVEADDDYLHESDWEESDDEEDEEVESDAEDGDFKIRGSMDVEFEEDDQESYLESEGYLENVLEQLPEEEYDDEDEEKEEYNARHEVVVENAV